jgi:hypothetical protein
MGDREPFLVVRARERERASVENQDDCRTL